MAKQEYFQNALSDFTYEAASGGAIRHLADLGYTVRQICGQLSYPTPYARVQKTVWQHLTDTGVVLTQEPGSGKSNKQKKAGYVMERDKYGRTSFRMVAAQEEETEPVIWKERQFGTRTGRSETRMPGTEEGRRLAACLDEKCAANNGEAYVSCRIGLMLHRDPAAYESLMEALNERQREYLSGLPWEERICYHRLDRRMQEIVTRLYTAGKFQGSCYFMKTGEKVTIG